jgi:acetylornithine deacetylase/succinyl-diaminopimelate desuccinylase-like protein
MRLFALLLFAFASVAHAETVPDPVGEAKEILKRSVSFRTVEGQGQVPAYAVYLASVLKGAGFSDKDITITPMGETATLVLRYAGTTNAKPILLIGHMDVVEAKAEDWGRDPFTAVEENGYIFGRGVEDNKFDVSMMVTTLVRLKREGFRPRRTIVLALSGDEEMTGATAKLLAAQFKGAEMVLNGDGGGGILSSDFKPVFYSLQAAEKTYADYQIEITDPGGHSSTPTSTNAIYRLARILDRLDAYHFPNQTSELTRAALRSAGRRIGGEVGGAMIRYADNPADTAAADIIAAQPEYVGQIRTTCVATMVSAGHAPNALPQRAAATVNCRIYPGASVAAIKNELERVAAAPSAHITVLDDPEASDASPLRKDLLQAVTTAMHARFPDLEITPSMSAGATDSLFYRAVGVPSYGITPLFKRPEDDFIHGLNERVRVAEIAPALAYYRTLITSIAK